MLIASIHTRILPASLAVLICPVIFDKGSRDDHDLLRASRVTAALLLFLFVCHLAFICLLHSAYPLQALGLQRMANAHDNRDSADSLSWGMSGRITSSTAYQIQIQQKNWLCERLLLSDAPGSMADSRKPWDSAFATVILLLSGGASLSSCFHLISSVSPEDAMSWKSPLNVGYLIAPFLITMAGLSAMYLHDCWCTSALDLARVVCGAITSTSRLLGFMLPTSILAGWIASSGQDIALLESYQIALLAIFVLLPVHAIQTYSDDWLMGATLLALYIIYASSAWCFS
ncbi:hypothetical protein GQ44DRAFT_434734 [Phaeosphaeriaceae sp. PMI808]|nr:hypothetical protein GQ44DRAFT_434734 [Phaeosphaeriaceae sp. PMI808]